MQIEFSQLHCQYCFWLLAAAGAAGLVWAGITRLRRKNFFAGFAALIFASCGFSGWCLLAGRVAGVAVMAGMLAACVIFFYAARYGDISKKAAVVLTLLRLAVLGGLLLVLLKPTLVINQTKESLPAAKLKILLDSSASMSMTDDGEKSSRYAQAIDSLKNILPKLQLHADIEFFTFADSLKPQPDVKSTQAVKPDGKSTDIIAAIKSSAASDKNSHQSAVLIFSDGCQNGPSSLAELDARRQGVFAVGVGSADEKLNRPFGRGAAVIGLKAPFAAAINRETKIIASVRMVDIAGKKCTATLYEDGVSVGQVDITSAGSDVQRDVEFTWRPVNGTTRGDVRNLRVEVDSADDPNTRDNYADATVLIRRPAIKTLIIEGTIRPEYKYLRRVLAADTNMQVVSFVRMSENRFWAQGSIDGVEMQLLPSDEKGFGQFDVIILGDVAAEYFTRQQLAAMKSFVSSGGGLVMLGGRNSFSAGGWQDTVLADVLPVQLGAGGQIARPFDMTLTSAGMVHPIFDGLRANFNSPAGKSASPVQQLEGCVRTGAVKAAAELLACDPSAENAAVLAVQNYGKGRAAAFTGDTTWRWYLSGQRLGQASPYVKFWLQMARWLAGSDASKDGDKKIARVIVRADRQCVRVGDGDVKFTGVVIDAAPDKPLKVQYEIRGDGGYRKPIIFSVNKAGELSANWTPQQSGEYELVRILPDNALPEKIKINVEQSDAENTIRSRNDSFMSALTAATDGFYAVRANEDELAGRLINHLEQLRSQAVKTPAKRVDAYDFTLILILMVVLLAAEWVIRHKKSLR